MRTTKTIEQTRKKCNLLNQRFGRDVYAYSNSQKCLRVNRAWLKSPIWRTKQISHFNDSSLLSSGIYQFIKTILRSAADDGNKTKNHKRIVKPQISSCCLNQIAQLFRIWNKSEKWNTLIKESVTDKSLSLTLKREVSRHWPKSKSKNLLFMFEILAKFRSLDVNIYGRFAGGKITRISTVLSLLFF